MRFFVCVLQTTVEVTPLKSNLNQLYSHKNDDIGEVMRTELTVDMDLHTNTCNLIFKHTVRSHMFMIYSDLASSDNTLSELHGDIFSDCCTIVIQPLRPLIANSVSLIKVQNYSSLFKPSKHICGYPLCKKKNSCGLIGGFFFPF